MTSENIPAPTPKVKRPRIYPGPFPFATLSAELLNLDRDLHAEGHVRHAVALVRPRGGARERHVVLLVGLHEEWTREVAHRVRHPLLQRVRPAFRDRVAEE